MELQQLLQELTGTSKLTKVFTSDAEIVSVNKDERTCVVNSADDNYNFDGITVRYMPCVSDGDFNIPEVGSIVTIIVTSFTEPYIISYSDLEEKNIVIGNQGIFIKNDLIKFNDGGFGGVPIVKNPNDTNAGLLKKINQLETKVNGLTDYCDDLKTKINQLITVFAGWTPIAQDGGAALKTAAATWYGSQVTTTKTKINPATTESDISNPKITHGKEL